MEKQKSETDEQIRKILLVIAHRIQDKDASDYTTDCFRELEHLLREAKNAAEDNYNNKLRKGNKKDVEYIAMRQKQYNVLLDMYKTAKTLETKPHTAHLISDFFDIFVIEAGSGRIIANDSGRIAMDCFCCPVSYKMSHSEPSLVTHVNNHNVEVGNEKIRCK